MLIAQITDLHIGFDRDNPHELNIRRLNMVIDQLNAMNPKPDLVIRNPTPHGILIWTSYTDTSISVSLWSTKHFEAAQSGQTKSPRGNCTFVRTDRTRKTPDGTVLTDRVNALYRPGEGVQC